MLCACVNAIADETRAHRVFLAGHSLGGTLSAIYAACHPERVAGLVLVEVPLPVAEASSIIRPESILHFCRAVQSKSKQWLPYFGDLGVALSHVDALVGSRAHRAVWPRIFDWLHHTATQ